MADDTPLVPQQHPQFLPPEQNLTFEVVPRHMRIYQLNDSDIDSLSSSNNAGALTFFGVSLGVAASFGSTLFSGSAGDGKHYATCLALTWSFGLLAVFFGIFAAVQWRKSRKTKSQIKESKIIKP